MNQHNYLIIKTLTTTRQFRYILKCCSLSNIVSKTKLTKDKI